MEKIRLLDNIDASRDLLSMPDTLVKVLGVVSSEDSSPDEIAAIILQDPSLTARVLRMANSSFYRRAAPITTVHQGVRVLGFNALKCIALSISIFTLPRGKNPGEIDKIRQFYFHSLGVALMSLIIADRVSQVDPEEAFIAGLLHDIGQLYMLHGHTRQYLNVVSAVEKGDDIIDVERRYFDVDHAELGSIIANRWHLPESLQRVIRSHHHLQPGSNPDTLVRIVQLANLLTCNIQTPNLKAIERWSGVISELAESLSLDREFLDSSGFLLLDETIKVADSIGIDIGDTTELLNRANRELCKAYLMIETLFRERQELSGKLLEEERLAGMMRAKNIAIATLSHYLNNVATTISGRIQLLQLALEKGEVADSAGKMPPTLKVIDNSILKLLAVLAELKSLSRFDDQSFYNDSDALNIDERIKARMQSLEKKFVNA